VVWIYQTNNIIIYGTDLADCISSESSGSGQLISAG
jgi:hypothetical protein